MYPQQFAAAGYDPVDPPVFLSLSPILAALLALLVLLALAAGWFARERLGPRPHDPCEAIYNAIRRAAEDALKAPRDQVHARAGRLADEVDRRLGGLLAFAGGLGAHRKALRLILKGERPPAHEGARGAHGGGHGARGGHADAHAGVVVVNTGSLVVAPAGERAPGPDGDRPHDPPGHGGDHGHGVGAHGGHGHGGHGHDHAPDPALGHKEQVALLRAEIHNFNDYWGDRAARLAELRAARADLC